MQFTFIAPVLISMVFGLVVSAVYFLIVGGITLRAWLAEAWRLACLCYIILFGVIRI